MALTADEVSVVERITKRLRSADEATYRAGGRAVAQQAVDHRLEMVRVLRGAVDELAESESSERRLGYRDALLDLLVATEALLEPRELEGHALKAIESAPMLQHVLGALGPSPQTPGQLAERLGKSPASAGRYLEKLRDLGLAAEMPNKPDARERPHRLTALGVKLARASAPVATSEPPNDAVGVSVAFLDSLATGRRAELQFDPATGLRLLDEFEKRLGQQLGVHQRAKLPVSLLRLDIRDFQSFRKEAGFESVNRYILMVSDMLKEALDPVGTEVARYDWDKFLVMLPSSREAEAEQLATTVLTKLHPVRARIGIAEDRGNRDATTMLLASNNALTHARDANLSVAFA